MIAARKLELKVMRAVTKFGIDPDTDQPVPLEFADQLHLFMEPGGYCKHTNGVWAMQPPARQSLVYHLRSGLRQVTEHDDGTISVSGPPMGGPNGMWRLEKGFWIEVS